MFKSLNGGLLPQRATKYSAGFDVFANEDTMIGVGEMKVIGLGICIDSYIFEDESDCEFNDGMHFKTDAYGYHSCEQFYIELHPRSSLRTKGLGGGVGIIDMDYRDEIKMVISNPLQWVDEFNGNINSTFIIKRGDKIGQLILKRHEGWLLPAEYTKDEERTGGFGSTDE